MKNLSMRLKKITGLALVLMMSSVMVYAIEAPDESMVEKVRAALPDKPREEPAEARRILVFNLCKGYAHGSIPLAAKAFELLGEQTGAYEAVLSEDMNMFRPENLSKFDAVLMNNTTGKLFQDPALRQSLIAFVKSGKGLIGCHAATDCCYGWKEYGEMMGGFFDGHPWSARDTVTVKLDDPGHTLSKVFAGRGFSIKDEIYQFKDPYSRENLRILLSIDTAKTDMDKKGIKRTDDDFAIAWIRSYGKGRVFYCSLGHNNEVFWNPDVLQFYLDGIQFALGDLESDTTPSAKLSAEYMKQSQAVGKNLYYQGVLDDIAEFEYGMNPDAMKIMRTLVIDSQDNPAERSDLEQDMIHILEGPSTVAGKEFACRQLYLIGSEESVPVLGDLLDDKDFSDMARYALERMDNSEADKTLLKALDHTEGKIQAGIINSLGQRRYERAVSRLEGLLMAQDEQVATAVVRALGNIGNSKAADILLDCLDNDAGMQAEVYTALVECAANLRHAGSTRGARKIYQRLDSESSPMRVRMAALKGLIAVEGQKSFDRRSEILKSAETGMRWAAVDMLRDLPTESLTPWLVTLYTDLDAQSKVYVLNVFRDKVIKDAQRVCIESLDDHSEDVQLAAASALEKIGDGKAILPLAKVASDSRGDLERFSRKALTRLKGKNINAQIAALLGSQESEVQEELIRALVDRNATEAVPVFFAMAGDSDKDVREAAYRGLWALGRLGDLPAVLRLMMKEESTTVLNKAAQAAVALARKAEEPQTPGGAVIRCLPEGALDVNAQKAVLKVLGELGDDNALFYIRREMRNANEDIREAAARALADWPRETVLPDLMNLAGNTESQILKVLSIRAVLRLIPLKKDMEVEEKLQLYKDLLTLATRAQEKRIALDAVAGLDHPQVQAVIEEYADDPDLKEYAIEAAREKLAMREYAAKDLVPVIKNDMIQCDGDLGEWQKYAFPITSNNRKQKRIDATFRVAWNDKGLAFAVVAKDDPPEFGKDLGMMWSRDCIQVAIDPLNEDKKGGYGPNDLEIGFGFRTRFEGGVHAWHLPASVDEELLENIPMHVGYSSGFITYEIILPWEFLSLMKKEDGYQFGMNIAVTDLDRNRKWIGAQWTPGILEGKSAAFFNTLVLVEKL